MGEKKYNLSPQIFERAEIKGEPETMSEWIASLSEDELQDWFMIANREKGLNSRPEITQMTITALVLLSYEINTTELNIPQDKMLELMGKFRINLLIEKGRREGIYIVPKGLTLGANTEVELTEKGKAIALALQKQENNKTYGSTTNPTSDK